MFLSFCAFLFFQAAAGLDVSEPLTIHVFTNPHGTKAAEERMRLAVDNAKEIVELSDWIELVDERDAAEITVEIRAYALADDGSAHYVYAEVDILGEHLVLVGADEHERASRMRAVSALMEKLQDYCADNFAKIDAKRRAT